MGQELLPLDGLEERAEVPLPESLMPLPRDDLVEEWSGLLLAVQGAGVPQEATAKSKPS